MTSPSHSVCTTRGKMPDNKMNFCPLLRDPFCRYVIRTCIRSMHHQLRILLLLFITPMLAKMPMVKNNDVATVRTCLQWLCGQRHSGWWLLELGDMQKEQIRFDSTKFRFDSWLLYLLYHQVLNRLNRSAFWIVFTFNIHLNGFHAQQNSEIVTKIW